MGTLGRSGRWPAFGLSATLGVGGVALMSSRSPSTGTFWIGCVLLAGGLVMFAVAFIAGLIMDSRRHEAREALRVLIAAGDVAWRARNDGLDPTTQSIDQWRATLARLDQSPFIPGTSDDVLVLWGDLITEPLSRLRNLRAHVDDYIR